MKHHRDLCIIARHRVLMFESATPVVLEEGQWAINITVLSSIFWTEGQEVDPSPLSRALGDFGVDGSFSTTGLGRIDEIFFGLEPGPWTCLPCVIVYKMNPSGSIEIREIKVLDGPEIKSAVALAERMYDARVKK